VSEPITEDLLCLPAGESMDKTPETNSAAARHPSWPATASGFARQLERERDEARKAEEQAKSDRNRAGVEERRKYLPEIARLSARIAELEKDYRALYSQVAGYLDGANWDHWIAYNAPRFSPDKAIDGAKRVTPSDS
jgi:outer membrane murein-binding lipoprotein Lpp